MRDATEVIQFFYKVISCPNNLVTPTSLTFKYTSPMPDKTQIAVQINCSAGTIGGGK